MKTFKVTSYSTFALPKLEVATQILRQRLVALELATEVAGFIVVPPELIALTNELREQLRAVEEVFQQTQLLHEAALLTGNYKEFKQDLIRESGSETFQRR